jgi:hypothetical protein
LRGWGFFWGLGSVTKKGDKEVIELVYIGYMRGVYIGIGHMVES